MAVRAHFAAVDLGASSGRVLLGSWDGNRIGLQELHRFANEPIWVQGHWHWDILALWSGVQTGLTRYAAQHRAPLRGLGVDGWGLDFALLDRAGQLLGNPYAYRDARTEGVPEQVFRRVSQREIFTITGIECMRVNTLYQLWAMARSGDPQLDAAHTLLMIPDLLRYWLTGERAVEYTVATTSQLLDFRERRWAVALMDRLDLRSDILPPLIATGTILGETNATVQRALGLHQPVPVIAVAAHDTASAVSAIPGMDSTSAYVSSGTWSLMGVEVAEPLVSDEALRLGVTNEAGIGGTVRLQKNIAGLWLLQECLRHWQHAGQQFTWDGLLAEAAQATPFRSVINPDAPEFISPAHMPTAIRAFCRRTGQPQPETVGELVRCCLESLALRYRWVLRQLEQLTGRELRTIRVVGGGSQNQMLCQFTADATGCQVVAGPVEAAALGNLVLQAVATGYIPDIATGRTVVARSVKLHEYAPVVDERWDAAAVRFEQLL